MCFQEAACAIHRASSPLLPFGPPSIARLNRRREQPSHLWLRPVSLTPPAKSAASAVAITRARPAPQQRCPEKRAFLYRPHAHCDPDQIQTLPSSFSRKHRPQFKPRGRKFFNSGIVKKRPFKTLLVTSPGTTRETPSANARPSARH